MPYLVLKAAKASVADKYSGHFKNEKMWYSAQHAIHVLKGGSILPYEPKLHQWNCHDYKSKASYTVLGLR